jgi:GDP-mannose 6-dehydrogenase
MKIAVFGLGYVGAVSAAGFASQGHDVVGVDTSELKVEMLNRGEAPVREPGLTELTRRAVNDGHLRATTNASSAIENAEVSLVCVGTPSASNGSLSTVALERVASTIGEALPRCSQRHTVVIRSTMVPSTSEDVIIPILERTSGASASKDFGFAVNPEFLREGSSLCDFFEPAKTVIGEIDVGSGDAVASLYNGSTGPVIRLPVRAAEMAKYVDNTFHALKISFANEIGQVCRVFGLDSHEVMKSFFADTKLNISPAYLTPGFAFGGSCLPKDLRALLYAARRRDLELPVLENILRSNEQSITRIVDTIIHLGKRNVGLFGLSFKAQTDDLRESPFVELSERLLGKGFQLKIYDPAVSVSRLVGTNREYIEERIPHLSAVLADSVHEVLEHAEVCIVGAAQEETVHALANSNGRLIVDLVRLPDAEARRGGESYVGVAW